MFWNYCLVWLLHNITNNCSYIHQSRFARPLSLFVSFALSYIFFNLSAVSFYGHRFVLPFYISTSIVCLPFTLLGMYMQDILLERHHRIDILVLISAIAIYLSIILLNKNYDYSIDLVWCIWHIPYVIYITLSMCALVIVSFISKYLTVNIICYIGKNSLSILCTHLFFTRTFLYFCPDINKLLLWIVVVVLTLLATRFVISESEILTGRSKILRI